MIIETNGRLIQKAAMQEVVRNQELSSWYESFKLQCSQPLYLDRSHWNR